MGDLKWFSSNSDRLKDLCLELNLSQLISKPSRPMKLRILFNGSYSEKQNTLTLFCCFHPVYNRQAVWVSKTRKMKSHTPNTDQLWIWTNYYQHTEAKLTKHFIIKTLICLLITIPNIRSHLLNDQIVQKQKVKIVMKQIWAEPSKRISYSIILLSHILIRNPSMWTSVQVVRLVKGRRHQRPKWQLTALTT